VTDSYMDALEADVRAGDRSDDLVRRVANALREHIVSGQIPPGTKLVSEAQLAKTLGVSRPTLREAIRIVSREGLIVVRHGVGMFVSSDTKRMLGSLELVHSLTDLIRSTGGKPQTRDLKVDLVEPSADVAAALQLGPGSGVGRISRIRLIDDRPFVAATEYVVLDDHRRSFEKLKQFSGGSLYEFLRRRFDIRISHSKVRMSAVTVQPGMACVLKLARHAPLMLLREVHFTFDGQACLYAVNYHNTDIVEFTSTRSGTPA
jgi:GntR family transcriptional regulator